MRILLVDDDPDILEILSWKFNALGHAVVLAGSGANALTVVEQQAVDIVISDLQMPVMSGLELAKKLRALRPTLPVMLLTGSIRSELAVQGIRVFQKPDELDKLDAAVAGACSAQA